MTCIYQTSFFNLHVPCRCLFFWTADLCHGTHRHHVLDSPNERHSQTTCKHHCQEKLVALSNRFSALSADEPELHEVDTNCYVSWSDLDHSSTYSHESETKPMSHSRKSKRGPECAKHGGELAPSTVDWVEIKGVMDSGAAFTVEPPSVPPQMPNCLRRDPHLDNLILLQAGRSCVITNDLQAYSMT